MEGDWSSRDQERGLYKVRSQLARQRFSATLYLQSTDLTRLLIQDAVRVGHPAEA